MASDTTAFSRFLIKRTNAVLGLEARRMLSGANGGKDGIETVTGQLFLPKSEAQPATQRGRGGHNLGIQEQSSDLGSLGSGIGPLRLSGGGASKSSFFLRHAKTTYKTARLISLIILTSVIWTVVVVGSYWAWIDTTQPVTMLKQDAVFDTVSHKLQPHYIVKRVRYCKGLKHHFVQDGFRQNLPDVDLPSNSYIVGRDRPGEIFELYPTPIIVDPRVDDSFEYDVTLEYACNPLQRIFPLVISRDPIKVPQDAWIKGDGK